MTTQNEVRNESRSKQGLSVRPSPSLLKDKSVKPDSFLKRIRPLSLPKRLTHQSDEDERLENSADTTKELEQ